MEERELTRAFGDALVSVLDWAWPRLEAKVDATLERLADVVRPEPPMTLRTLDGQVVSGLVVLDRGQALLFLGVREPAPTVTTPPPRIPFEDADLWSGRVDPYRQR